MTPEFHRPYPADAPDRNTRDITVEANADECAALAQRFGLPRIGALACHFRLSADAAGFISATGDLTARITQVCVVTLDEFDSIIQERFMVRFVPTGLITDDIDPESVDEIPYDNGIIDLGEAAAEQLALCLDPYPHAAGADMLPLGEEAEDEAEVPHPFAALAARKRFS